MAVKTPGNIQQSSPIACPRDARSRARASVVLTRLNVWAAFLCIFSVSSAQAANKSLLDSPLVSSDSKNRLLQVERRRQELQERILQVRKKEKLAMLKLRDIQQKLSATEGQLSQGKHKLKTTEKNINQCEQTLTVTQTREQQLSDYAAKRLREIYEGQRLTFVEMLFQIDSLQALLDRVYYQERIAEQDKTLLAELRAKAASLAQRRGELDLQKKKIGDLVSEFTRRAMEIAREKLQQQQVADKLRTQRAFYERAERQLAMESHRLETQILEMENSQKKSNKNMAHGTGRMCMPLKAQVTSPFGFRRHPIFGVRRFHTGIDLAGPNRSAIRAADSGSVLYTGWYGGYGKVVIVSHGNGLATLYAHLSRSAVAVGDNVGKGDVIGYEGTTGFSTGPHLHFEVRVDGKPNNPLNYLR
ncbi:MAG TPA: peptidoglycan DD-metalloendopeptidase family protein [Candidatus Obscuribacterales bacterium]